MIYIDNNMVFTYGELFSGPGGLAYAAKKSSLQHRNKTYRIQHQWAVDNHEDSCATYRNNICPENENSVYNVDVRSKKFLEIMKDLPGIDVLAFGFPCNDFSAVGERKGINGEYGPLYSYGIKALKHFQPKWFLAENVGGIRNANEGWAFGQILNEMQEAGYNITAHLYKFEFYNVPQTRHRVIIIGIRNDLKFEFKIPAPTLTQPISSSEAIENPPIKKNVPNQELTNQSQQVIERLSHIMPGENAFTANLPNHLKLKVNGATISQIYKRLDPFKPAYTVTGSGGGGTHMYHWRENRALTNRERARLQTFPDDFMFCGSKESVRKQIGMAVPVEGAKIIFMAVLKTFANIQYKFVKANINNE